MQSRLTPVAESRTFYIRIRGITKYLHRVCRVQKCLASSKILTPYPRSTQRVCSPPGPKAGGYTLAGRCRWGGGGSVFWKTPDIGLASYSIIPLRVVSYDPKSGVTDLHPDLDSRTYRTLELCWKKWMTSAFFLLLHNLLFYKTGVVYTAQGMLWEKKIWKTNFSLSYWRNKKGTDPRNRIRKCTKTLRINNFHSTVLDFYVDLLICRKM